MKILIVGGGASGFMAAITAAETCPNAEIHIFERSDKCLNKVRISGGGRCNVTHRPMDNSDFSRQYPRGSHFIKKILHEFNAEDTMAWFTRRGVPLKTENDGRVFPVSDSSVSIINCLMSEVKSLGISIFTNRQLKLFEYSELTGKFTVFDQGGIRYEYDRLLIATGGFPKLSGYNFIMDTGIVTIAPYPSLFSFNVPDGSFHGLPGISVHNAVVKVSGVKFISEGPLLITHWGFSGPAVLKMSAFAAKDLHNLSYTFSFTINWIGLGEDEVRSQIMELRHLNGNSKMGQLKLYELPNRLWALLLQTADIDQNQLVNTVSNKQLNKLIQTLTACPFQAKGKTTYKEEFVTAGGVSLNEIDHRSMASKKIPGLFFAGEVLDVDGVTGGFNFQNAWSTGYIAGKHIGL